MEKLYNDNTSKRECQHSVSSLSFLIFTMQQSVYYHFILCRLVAIMVVCFKCVSIYNTMILSWFKFCNNSII